MKNNPVSPQGAVYTAKGHRLMQETNQPAYQTPVVRTDRGYRLMQDTCPASEIAYNKLGRMQQFLMERSLMTVLNANCISDSVD
ncbi:hypothetical protein AC249_AIPGENE23955 [Exaiptasia diaphana]|nr:hypothetical protein AC249_AIPGENE23955 [Exaiptasia diaphana]